MSNVAMPSGLEGRRSGGALAAADVKPNALTTKHSLPRLLYVGSLTVEATSAGQMQLYRIFRSYPAKRLAIIETECGASRPSERIPHINYYHLEPAFARGWNFISRHFRQAHWRALNLHASWQARRAARLVARFRPEAIVTIHDTLGWLVAEKLAGLLEVPLHLLLHDDWNRNFTSEPILREQANTHFAGTYRSAASRLCISPFMEEEYRERFGARGTVLYPTRGPDFLAPPRSTANARISGFTVAYAGNIFLRGYWDALRNLAGALRLVGGRLVVFGPSGDDAMRNDLVADNISVRGFVQSRNLPARLREEADVLFVPMSFEREHKLNMQISFPSKLAEYTAMALPLLIAGPDYCSAVRWARLKEGLAEVVTDQSIDAYTPALQRLSNPDWRRKLGERAFDIGNQLFSHESAWRVFTNALAS